MVLKWKVYYRFEDSDWMVQEVVPDGIDSHELAEDLVQIRNDGSCEYPDERDVWIKTDLLPPRKFTVDCELIHRYSAASEPPNPWDGL